MAVKISELTQETFVNKEDLFIISKYIGPGSYSSRQVNLQNLIDSDQYDFVTKTASYSAALTDQIILADATTGAIIITLPAVATSSGKCLWVKKTDSTVNWVTVKGNGAELIDASNTYDLKFQYNALQVVCDGTKWHIL